MTISVTLNAPNILYRGFIPEMCCKLVTQTGTYLVSGPSGKFRYKALGIKYCLVIFHDSTQRHRNTSVMYIHDLLKHT